MSLSNEFILCPPQSLQSMVEACESNVTEPKYALPLTLIPGLEWRLNCNSWRQSLHTYKYTTSRKLKLRFIRADKVLARADGPACCRPAIESSFKDHHLRNLLQLPVNCSFIQMFTEHSCTCGATNLQSTEVINILPAMDSWTASQLLQRLSYAYSENCFGHSTDVRRCLKVLPMSFRKDICS